MISTIVDLWYSLIDKIKEWYNYLAIAFTNWDSEIYQIRGDISNIISQGSSMLRKIMEGLAYIVREIGKVINEIYSSMGKGWR